MLLVFLGLALPPASSIAQPCQSGQLCQTGRWQGPYVLKKAIADPVGYVGTHVAALKGPGDTTRVLLFGESGAPQKIGVWSFVPTTGLTIPKTEADPGTANFHGVVRPAHDLFCSGHASVKGRLVVVGGQYRPDVGTETAYEFNPLYYSPTHTDPQTGAPVWRALAGTAQGRWYPTATGLATGNKLLAMSGTKYGYVFTFGGSTGTLQNELRPLGMGNTVDWTSPTVSGTPPQARKDHSAILDHGPVSSYAKRMVVFGGETGSGQKTNNVSAQSLNGDDVTSSWLTLTVVPDSVFGVPVARSRHTAIYHDPGGGNPSMIVYGGSDASGSALGDVWKLELERTTNTVRWTRLLANSGSDPGNRYGHTAIVDPGPGGLSSRMIVFGGRTSPSPTDLAPNTVWSLNLTGTPQQWTQISPSGGPPGAREGHGAVWDSYGGFGFSRVRMVIFGGHDGSQHLNETWSLWRDASLDAWTWTPVTGGPVPPARSRHASTRDWLWDRVVVFGGEDQTGLRDDLWTLDLGDIAESTLRWSTLTVRNPPTYPAPAARAGHTAVAHPLAIVERVPELFDLDAAPLGSWQPLPGAERFLDPYPYMFVLPSGNVFHAGYRPDTRVLKINSWTWDPPLNAPAITATYENAGSAVMYRPGSVLRCGQLGSDGDPGVSNTDTIRFSGPSDLNSGWTTVGGLSLRPRKFHNLTVLPTGDLLVTGGLQDDDSTNAQRKPQIWKRGTGSWNTELSNELPVRNYHSAAILLPDGRVLSTGGERFANGRQNPYRDWATIFEPPYLFNGDNYAQRPVIDSAPTTLTWGQGFTVCTSNPGAITKVCLIRPGAVTHGFNQDQRYVPLTSSVAPSGPARLFVTAPPSPAHAPPGDYLLFILGSTDGPEVPSIAKWVQLAPAGPDLCDAVIPGTISDLDADLVGSTEAWFTWSATADDGVVAASGTEQQFYLRRGLVPITSEETWGFATAGTQITLPGPLSTPASGRFTGLQPSTLYQAAVRASDDNSHLSGLHSTVTFQTTSMGDPEEYSARRVDGGDEGGGSSAPPASAAGSSSVTSGTADVLSPGGRGPASTTSATELGPASGTLLVETRQGSAGAWQISMHLLAPPAGSDPPAAITVEGSDAGGERDTLARFEPGPENNLLGLCALRDGGRLGIPGVYRLERLVPQLRSRRGDYVLDDARHSRLGVLSGGAGIELLVGDSLSLSYAPAAEALSDPASWYALVRRTSDAPPIAMGSRPGQLGESMPTRFALHQNRPNPFRGTTVIAFDLPVESAVRLEVFDLLGRRVATLADGFYPTGRHGTAWDLRDADGARVRPGIYVCRISAGAFRARQKLSVLP